MMVAGRTASRLSPGPSIYRRGIIDLVKDGYVAGWAFEHHETQQSASLFMWIDDTPVANFFCTYDRPDLEAVGLRTKMVGFHEPIPEQYLDNTLHRLTIRFSTGEYLLWYDAQGGSNNSVIFKLPLPIVLHSYVDGLVEGAVRGWAVHQQGRSEQKTGGLAIAVEHEGVSIGLLRGECFRPDVGRAINCDPYCGFQFVPPARYRQGDTFVLRFRDLGTNRELEGSPVTLAYQRSLPEAKIAQLTQSIEDISVQLWRMKAELRHLSSRTTYTILEYDRWARQYQDALRARRRRMAWPADRPMPLVSIVCPVYRPRLKDFKAAVESVMAQTYQNWELILVDDHSKSTEVTEAIEGMCRQDSRIRSLPQKKNLGISDTTNVAIAAARGEYVVLFDHDDLLVDVAIEIMLEEALRGGYKLLYSDEDKIDDYGRFSDPNLKPDFNYRLLLGQNYVCHLLLVEAETLRAAGPLNSAFDGAQDHDLVLRLFEILDEQSIRHVPEIIYHWRKTPGSTASTISNKAYAISAGASAVESHLARIGKPARAVSLHSSTTYRLEWEFTEQPSVTIIVPFKDQATLTRRCVETVLAITTYENFDIILADNWSIEPETVAFCEEIKGHSRVRIMRIEEPFNFSRLNNLASRETASDYLLFMNNDVFVEQPRWLQGLMNEALVDVKVGAVGAKLLFPDRRVQHSGVILGVGGVGDHACRGRGEDDPFFMGRGICAQEMSAVTAALMLCRADAFRSVGGFDEVDLAVAYNDVDLCLKLRKAGYRIIFTPDVVAEHHESVSRGDDMKATNIGRFIYEEQTMLHRWRAEIARDPFYNPHFSPDGGIFEHFSESSLR